MPRVFGKHANVEVESGDNLIKPWEKLWVEHQPFLLQRGYLLPERYRQGWVPSWLGKNIDQYNRYHNCPDSQYMFPFWPVLDATRVADGTRVVLKVVCENEDIPFLEYLNSPELLEEERNHTVPLLDKIPVPNDSKHVWIVMPYLLRISCRAFPFTYVSEVVDCMSQVLEGLEFMHEHRIAHRDACYLNIMMDSSKLLPDGDMSFFRTGLSIDWKRRVQRVERRSVEPLKYYFIDFETAIKFPPGQEECLCVGRYGQERNAPELSETTPYNPFKLDIYQVGMIIEKLSENYEGMEILHPFQQAMTRENPEDRPTATEARVLFKTMVLAFSEEEMSQRVWSDIDVTMGRRKHFEKSLKPKKTLRAFLARMFSFSSTASH